MKHLVVFLLAALSAYGQIITVSPASVPVGGTVSVTVSGGANRTDVWVGEYVAGSVAVGQYKDWVYMSGTRTAPASPITTATVQFTMPTAGSYVFTVNGSDAFDPKATSTPITVTGNGPPPVIITAGSVQCTISSTAQLQVQCSGLSATSTNSYPVPITNPGHEGSLSVKGTTISWTLKPSTAQPGKTDWQVGYSVNGAGETSKMGTI